MNLTPRYFAVLLVTLGCVFVRGADTETPLLPPPPTMAEQPPGKFVWRAQHYVCSEVAMIWDNIHGQFLTWGGHFLDIGHEQSDDVWAFSPESPQWTVQPQINAPRAGCCAHQLSFDSLRGNLLVSGGDGEQSHGWMSVTLQGFGNSAPMTYNFKKNEWTARRPVPAAPNAGCQFKGFVYHPYYDLHVLVGGIGTPAGTWFYNPHRNEWSELTTENEPGPRSGAVLALHPETQEVLMWGGPENDHGLYVLSISEARWRKVPLPNAPPTLFQPLFVFDPHADAFVLIGSNERTVDKKPRMEIWKLRKDLSAWESIALPTEGDVPGHQKQISELGFSAAYSPELNIYLIAAGGFGPHNFQTWSYRIAPTKTLPSSGKLAAQIATTSSEIQLNWTAVEDAANYEIFRQDGLKIWVGKAEKMGETSELVFIDKKIVQGQAYIYRVLTHLADGRVIHSPPLQFCAVAPDGPQISVLAADTVELSLPPRTEKNIKYTVERARLKTNRFVNKSERVQTGIEFSAFENITPEPVDAETFQDKLDLKKIDPAWQFEQPPNPICVVYGKAFAPAEKFNPLAVYAYRIRCVNAQGVVSGPSAWALTLPAAPQTPTVAAPPPDDEKNGIVTLNWPPIQQKKISGYRVYRQLTMDVGPRWKKPWDAPFHLDANRWHKIGPDLLTECKYEDASIPGGNLRRRYYVSAVDEFGQEGPPSTGAWAYRPLTYDEPPLTKVTSKLFVPELDTPAKIDGTFDEEQWKSAAQMSLRFMDGRKEPPSQPTNVRLFTNGGKLFAAITCKEPVLSELIEHPDWPHDCNFLWKDDTVEFAFLLNEEAKGPLHHLMFSSTGISRDSYGTLDSLDKKAWNPDVECVVSKGDGDWRLEFGISLNKFFSLKGKPSVWRVNVMRNRQQSEHRTGEESGWAPSFSPRTNVPCRMGYLYFQALGAKATDLEGKK